MAQKQHFSLRLPQHVLDRLEEQAAASGATKTALAERYVAEAVAEIDGWIARNGAVAEQAEAAWRRRQAVTG